MANQQKDPPQGAGGVEGEGSYTATRGYKKSVDRFVQQHEDEIGDMARDAADALDSDEERQNLEKAEKQGLNRAKH